MQSIIQKTIISTLIFATLAPTLHAQGWKDWFTINKSLGISAGIGVAAALWSGYSWYSTDNKLQELQKKDKDQKAIKEKADQVQGELVKLASKAKYRTVIRDYIIILCEKIKNNKEIDTTDPIKSTEYLKIKEALTNINYPSEDYEKFELTIIDYYNAKKFGYNNFDKCKANVTTATDKIESFLLQQLKKDDEETDGIAKNFGGYSTKSDLLGDKINDLMAKNLLRLQSSPDNSNAIAQLHAQKESRKKWLIASAGLTLISSSLAVYTAFKTNKVHN